MIEHRVRVGPGGGWRGIGVAELWDFRELLYLLSKRELQVRYKQSVFGIGWALVQPLALAAVFSVIFGTVIEVPSQGVAYPLLVLTGFTAWMFVAQTVSSGGLSLVVDSNLLTKVYFPRLILPLARAAALLVDLGIALGMVVLIAAAFGHWPEVRLLTLPLWLALMLVTALGATFFTAALNVRYRDVSAVLPLVVQVWLFLTPIAYPESVIPASWQYVYAVNPVATAVTGLRWALLGTPPPSTPELAISTASALALIVVGVAYFRRSERTFADLI